MDIRRIPARSVTALLVAAMSLSLSGCLQEVPIVSNETHNETTNMTLTEQRAWVGAQLAEGIDASGVAEGWFSMRPTIPWSEQQSDRDGVLNMLLPLDCGLGGRLVAYLSNADADATVDVGARVRGLWESEGWTVTNVRGDDEPGNPYFRADRDDGAVLAFQASSRGMTLSVESACSVNNTVTNWEDYVDDVPRQNEEEMQQEWDGE